MAYRIRALFTALWSSEPQCVHYIQCFGELLQSVVYSVRIACDPSKVLQIVCGSQLRFLRGLWSGDLVPTTICDTLELLFAIRTLFATL